MVRKVPAAEGPVKYLCAGTPACSCRYWALFLLGAAILVAPPAGKADSPASKNREGNRLFGEGRYEEAEKAYLEAQVKSPGKPEILYNLGNSLVKQGKYPQGVRALGQAAGKGGMRIKADSLYNTGNALFSMGDYKGSAEAFIEALKLDPEDGDAKHNLELALRKLQEEEQKQRQDANRDQKNPPDQKEPQASENEEGRSQPGEQDSDSSGNRNNQEEPAEMKPENAVPREDSMTREQAERILDAVRNQELDEQRRLIESRSMKRSGERDW
ncbi:MAG: tetratricopeptide repeat protein [Acidobacteria bacterium]|nr:tetratricopeptide repeat protein [Acidobacteriota bacterium]